MAVQTPSHDALAWLALALAPDLGPRTARTLVERFGTPHAVLDASGEALLAAGASPAAVGGIRCAPALARVEATRLARAAATLVTLGDAEYPARLRHIADPPLTLAVRGSLDAPDEPAVAVVGMRRASEYGRRVAGEIGRELAQAGITVVSGLAAGIDAAAHRAALAAGGRTIAVLGTGVDRVYPSWHVELARAIAAQGALVSEFACGVEPRPYHFPRRNRVISGLSLGTVVVEAAEQSGSLITAEFAVQQNRQVYAVPGPLGVAGHRGPHRLIQEGAKLFTRIEDIVQDLAPQLGAGLVARRTAALAATLTAPEQRVLEALGCEGRHVDDVIRAVAVPPGRALETLLALELRGLVRQLPGKRFCRLAA
jgi:DNA processing protein